MQILSNDKQENQTQSFIQFGSKRSVVGGVIAAGVIFLGTFLINVSSGSESRVLLESMLPSIRFLCSAVMTASSTILALMLTMLSMSSGSDDRQYKTDYYDQVRKIARLDTAVFAGAIILLMFISIPLSESQDVPANWHTVLYYGTLVATAVLGGSLISIIMMLYKAVTGLIAAKHPNKASHLVKDQE